MSAGEKLFFRQEFPQNLLIDGPADGYVRTVAGSCHLICKRVRTLFIARVFVLNLRPGMRIVRGGWKDVLVAGW